MGGSQVRIVAGHGVGYEASGATSCKPFSSKCSSREVRNFVCSTSPWCIVDLQIVEGSLVSSFVASLKNKAESLGGLGQRNCPCQDGQPAWVEQIKAGRSATDP